MRKWQHPNMFAGVKGGGADLAWQEWAELQQYEYLLAMADIWKCYDQLIPILIHVFLALAGMPLHVLAAYARLMHSISVMHCLAFGAGTPYQKPCSIPQGCPWSMMALALLVRPWILMIESQTAAIPRALADDLCLWTQGWRQAPEGTARQPYVEQRYSHFPRR